MVGTTGGGKGVAAGVLLTQAVRDGEAVCAFDPKNDEFLAHVLYQAAHEAGVPFVFIDLAGELPQWNPLYKKSAFEIEEMLNAAFCQGERGTDADFYRLDDRHANRLFSQSLPAQRPTIQTAQVDFFSRNPQLADKAKKFFSDLEEIALAPVIATDAGIDLERLFAQGAVVYVRGSMRNPRILKLQRMLLVSAIQFIEKRDRDDARYVCVFLDEFKYVIARPALEALGAIRDKKAHVIIAHQSIGDLRDCPSDLNPDSVVASVNENCALKLACAVKDPDTAEWLSRMSGHILVDDEIRQMKTNLGLAETRENGRTLRQAERPLIDTNMLMSLPDRCAVLFGCGLAQFVFAAPVPVEKTAEATRPFVVRQDKTRDMREEFAAHKQPTVARAMVDVD